MKVNSRNSKQNSSTAAQSTEKIRSNGQSANASTTKSGSGRNDTLKFTVHTLLTVTGHDQALILKLLGNVARSGAGNLNPGLGKESASNEHKGNVDGGVNGVQEGFLEVERRRHVVSDTRGSIELSRSLARLPDAQKTDQKVVRETRIEHLADQEDVGAESRLEHDRHVRGIEQTDGVGSAHTTLARRLDGNLNAESLKVNDSGENQESGQKVHDVGEILAVESLLQSTLLVGPGQEQVEESNDGTLELGASTGVNGCGGESLPDDRLADVGGNEEGDTTSKTVSLLQQFVEKNDDETSNNQLDNQKNADTGTEVTGLTIETSKNVNASLTKGQDDGKEFLSGLVQFTVGLEVEVDVDEVGSGKKL